jgi:hypothetical protein
MKFEVNLIMFEILSHRDGIYIKYKNKYDNNYILWMRRYIDYDPYYHAVVRNVMFNNGFCIGKPEIVGVDII